MAQAMHANYSQRPFVVAAVSLLFFALGIAVHQKNSVVSSSNRIFFLDPEEKHHHDDDEKSREQQQQQQKKKEERPPNILLLFPDQWRYDWDGRAEVVPNNQMSSSSSSTTTTKKKKNTLLPLELPHLRELTRHGTHFWHAYVASPLCAPARACLAGGLEYDHAGVPTNQHNDYDLHIPTFYTALRDTYKYKTYTVGKDDLTKASKLGTKRKNNHHQGNNNWTTGVYHQHELGFSDGSIRCSGKTDVVSSPQPHERYGHWLNQQSILLQNGTTVSGWDAHVVCLNRTKECTSELYPDALYEDDWVTRQAIAILEEQQQRHNEENEDGSSSEPWFLQVNFPGPHPPFLVTPTQYRAVWNKTFPPPVDNPKLQTPETCTNHQFTRATSRCNYAAEMENLDRNIGRILQSVNDNNNNNNNNNNTIICFASDHGEMLLDHQWNGKTVPWQASVSVPLICRGPGIRAGAVVERPVATMDLAATFLDYAGGGGGGGGEDAEPTARITMTSKSLRTLLETGEDADYRTFVSSGFQSMPFGDTSTTTTTNNNGQNWRMVVEASTGLKLVCCRGKCHGAPSTIPPVNEHGYQQVLIDTLQDPFDMKPLNEELPIAMERLRAWLPESFGCK
jgi:arylsulfatase